MVNGSAILTAPRDEVSRLCQTEQVMWSIRWILFQLVLRTEDKPYGLRSTELGHHRGRAWRRRIDSCVLIRLLFWYSSSRESFCHR
ncbi:hypothetical protein OPV22_017181 [Ensete ventricosum]|uniref:Uncharacterized protein n=1 Tax=Ensete ventricosum TaxID=4639 RepID=A0AAV8QSH6_ENSVE|nr:hypothetical protein OPV22_017181 [Ensete ventricosum]